MIWIYNFSAASSQVVVVRRHSHRMTNFEGKRDIFYFFDVRLTYQPH